MYNDYMQSEETQSITECKRLEAPTVSQIKEVKTIFNDFGIALEIPSFRTFAELDIFRRTAIFAAVA